MFEIFYESPVGDNVHGALYEDSKGMIRPPDISNDSAINEFGQVEIAYHDTTEEIPVYEDLPGIRKAEEGIAQYLASEIIGENPAVDQRIGAIAAALLTRIGTNEIEKLVDGINKNLSETGRRLEVSFSNEEGFLKVVNLVQYDSDGSELGNLEFRFS